MSTAAPARTAPARIRRRPRAVAPGLPAAGPAWFGAVMGTGALATLGRTMAPAGLWLLLARAMLVLGWLLLVGLSVLFVDRGVRHSGVWVQSRRATQLPLWGMVAMGALAVGAATAAVLPGWVPGSASAAWLIDGVLWVAATGLGLVTAVGFTALLIRTDPGTPTLVWGLAVVPPMVSATVGAGLVPHLAGPALRLLVLVGAIGCFCSSLFAGAVVFGVCLIHHWRVAGPPVAASATAWIPLGIVGQSTAASQAIAGLGAGAAAPGTGHPLQVLADGYGIAMTVLAVPLVAWAGAVTVRGFRARMPFVPGWWSMTFPIGTLALGAHLLGAGSGIHLFSLVGEGCTVALSGTWGLCAIASLTALSARRSGWSGWRRIGDLNP